MSYNVVITLPPTPADDRTAWAGLDTLIEAEGPVPDIFRVLVARLTDRYPCLTTLPDDRIDDGVWSDGPLVNDARHKVTELGLVYSRVADVLPFVVETANALGLTVFDGQEGLIHRP